MGRTIDPERWSRYYELVRAGHSRVNAARQAGISKNAVRRFEAGDPTSSGRDWLLWRRLREGTTTCPLCQK